MHAWIDISAGVAGDMVLGALLDAGADREAVQAAIDAVAPASVRLTVDQVIRGGQRATKAGVTVLVEDPPHRSWRTIRETLAGAAIDDDTRQHALGVFAHLAAAEARAHGIDPDEVHFHEVGALDSIADVVGACEALRLLGVTQVSASPVRLGAGRIRAVHGDIPVPVPAVVELVLGWQVYATPERAESAHHGHAGATHDHDHHPHHHHSPHHHGTSGHHHDAPAEPTTQGSVGELATPTGMALVRALASTCEPLPAMTPTRVGVGAGGKDFPGWPNVVRVLLGEPTSAPDAPATEVNELRANVDDLDPRLWPGVLDALLAAGAADAWLVPIQMKKGRPAFTVHALTDSAHQDAVVEVLITHTSTLGVRWTPATRVVLDRAWVPVDVLGHRIRVKVGSRRGRILHATPEFADVAAVARDLGRSEADVLHRAQAAAAAAGLLPGEAWAELPAGAQ